jgi:hypothetical protein
MTMVMMAMMVIYCKYRGSFYIQLEAIISLRCWQMSRVMAMGMKLIGHCNRVDGQIFCWKTKQKRIIN